MPRLRGRAGFWHPAGLAREDRHRNPMQFSAGRTRAKYSMSVNTDIHMLSRMREQRANRSWSCRS